MSDTDNINRLGFEAWADNLIVNMIEDLAPKLDRESVAVRCEKYAEETCYVVSAYVAGHGWLTHHRTVKHAKGDAS
jgi:hypothetical protein